MGNHCWIRVLEWSVEEMRVRKSRSLSAWNRVQENPRISVSPFARPPRVGGAEFATTLSSFVLRNSSKSSKIIDGQKSIGIVGRGDACSQVAKLFNVEFQEKKPRPGKY